MNFNHNPSDRKYRALHNPILLIDIVRHETNKKLVFNVLGSTVYNVTYNEYVWKCTCPDFKRRSLTCKHVYFVIARVLGKSLDDLSVSLSLSSKPNNLTWQQHHLEMLNNFGTSEQMLEKANLQIRLNRTISNDNEKSIDDIQSTLFQKHEKSSDKDEPKRVEQRPFEGEECCFCFEMMSKDQSLCFCERTCGKTVHFNCFERYIQSLGKNGLKCPFCRSKMLPKKIHNVT